MTTPLCDPPIPDENAPVTCHAFRPIPGAGVNLCTRPKGHATNHLDGVHNVSWPVVTHVTKEA